MRRRLLSNNNADPVEIPVQESLAGDAVFYNPELDEIFIRRENWQKNEIPIGVVVIPGSHNVYGNGACGVLSIVGMNCDTPKIGGNDNSMYWGVYGIDISTITNYNKVVVTANNTSNVANGLSTNIYAYIPSQVFIGNTPTRGSSPYAPSPYAGSDYKSGGYNESYSTTEFDTSSNHNVLADFDGRGNTDKILTQRGSKDYNSWKPTYNTESDYPAASCCDMFSTVGTEQGDWYLPSAGEFGYISPKFSDINDTIAKLKTDYGVGVSLNKNFGWWVSSEYGSKEACYMGGGNGSVNFYSKYNLSYVRAFLQLKPKPKFVDMGLSVDWAECNIGANNPEEYGWYFMWGGTIPYNSDRTPIIGGPAINFGYYSHCPYWESGTSDQITKWSKYTATDDYSSTGVADNKLILEPVDDAAYVHIGGDCRMPTEDEYDELLNACNTTWVTNYNGTGINGRLFTLKSDSTKTLFFPASGNLRATSWNNAGSYGYCWSSSLSSSNSYRGLLFAFHSEGYGIEYNGRYFGLPVRAVKPKQKPPSDKDWTFGNNLPATLN